MITILVSKIRVFVLAAVLGMTLGFVSPVYAKWYIVDLNTKDVIPIGPPNGNATAINDTGQVVGYFSTPGGDNHAFITGPNGAGMTDLGTLGGRESIALGINDAGQVVGFSNAAGSDLWNYPFITGPNGVGMTRLSTLSGGNTDYAADINSSGQVVGQFTWPMQGGHAFITGPNGIGMTDLGTILSGNFSDAHAVNDAGQVAGNSTIGIADERTRAFITGLDGAGMTQLGTLGGRHSFASGINETGQVVGFSYTRSGDSHAFITGPNGVGMTDLGTLGAIPDYSFSSASDINDAGRVVGSSFTSAGEYHAYVTGPNGAGMTDLNSLISPPSGFTWTGAYAINNHGQVIVEASVVPEPETYALLLAGLVLVGFMARPSFRVACQSSRLEGEIWQAASSLSEIIFCRKTEEISYRQRIETLGFPASYC